MTSSFPVDGGIEGFTQKRKALSRKAVGFGRRCQSVDGELPLSAEPVKPTQYLLQRHPVAGKII